MHASTFATQALRRRLAQDHLPAEFIGPNWRDSKMKMPFDRTRLITAGSLLLAGTVAHRQRHPLSRTTRRCRARPAPLPSSTKTLPSLSVIRTSSSARSSDRNTQLAANKPNSGNFDMNTVNETGPHKARYLFTVFETGESGVQRHDLETGTTDTIWQTPDGGRSRRVRRLLLDAVGNADHRRGIVGNRGRRDPTSPYGRLFELKNPITAPGHPQSGDRAEQCRRRLRASERHATHLSRRHSVRQSRKHVLH